MEGLEAKGETVIYDGNGKEFNTILSANLQDDSKTENDDDNKRSELAEAPVLEPNKFADDEEKKVDVEEDEEWLDILGSGQLKKKVRLISYLNPYNSLHNFNYNKPTFVILTF